MTKINFDAFAYGNTRRDPERMCVCGPVASNAVVPVVEEETQADASVKIAAASDVQRTEEAVSTSTADDVYTRDRVVWDP